MWCLRLPGDSLPFFFNKLILTWTHTRRHAQTGWMGLSIIWTKVCQRGVTSWCALCVCELLKQTHTSRANVPGVKAICKYVCVYPPGVWGWAGRPAIWQTSLWKEQREADGDSQCSVGSNKPHTPNSLQRWKAKCISNVIKETFIIW